MMIIQLPF